MRGLTLGLGLGLGLMASGSGSTATADLIVVMNQSNGQALGTDVSITGVQVAPTNWPIGFTSPRVLIWMGGAGWQQYQPYTNSYGLGIVGTWGYEAQFAARWLVDNASNSKTLRIVKYCVGGTGIDPASGANWWYPTTGTLYATLKAAVLAAKADLAASKVSIVDSAILGMPGEQDAKDNTTAANYPTNSVDLVTAMRADFGIQRIIVQRIHVEMTANGFPGWAVVFAAQGSAGAADQDWDFISTDYGLELDSLGGTPTAGLLHNTPFYIDRAGDRLYDTFIKWWTVGRNATAAFICDVNNDRYVIWKTAGNLATRKTCRLIDIFTDTTASTTTRTYVPYTPWLTAANGLLLRNDKAANEPRITHLNGKPQLLPEGTAINNCFYASDLSQTNWAKTTNVTATFDQQGPIVQTSNNFQNNTASLVTFGSSNGTILQTITAGSASRVFSAYVKRSAGSGTIQMTQDGTTFTTIAVSSVWQRFTLGPTTITNPIVGFKGLAASDAIIVALCQSEITVVTSPILTTTGNGTRNNDQFAFTAAAQAAFQGTQATYVVRGQGPTQTGAVFLSGDAVPQSLLGRNSNTVANANNGTTTAAATAGSGSFTTAFGIAGTFDTVAAHNKLCMNGGSVTLDTNAPAPHTNVLPFCSAARGATSYGNAPIDYVACHVVEVSDADLQALAVVA